MKKLLIMIYLSLLISSCNGEERKAVNNKVIDKVNDNKVKNSNNVLNAKNINWVKLTDDSEKDNEIVKNTKEGTAYVEIKGKRLICGKIKNGKRDGNWIYWHNNGVKKYEGTFINGKLNGIAKSWDENGKLEMEIPMREDKIEGEVKKYYPSGILKEKLRYVGNEREGESTTYYCNGEKRQELMYKKGKYEGESIAYYPTGQYKAKVKYENGKLNGMVTMWYLDGKKEEEGNCINDEREGKWTYWNGAGELEREEYYKGGKLVKTKNYEEVYDVNDKSKNWVKLKNDGWNDDDNKTMKNVKEGVGYVKAIKGTEKYVCGRIKDGKREGHWKEYAISDYSDIYLYAEGVYRNGKGVGNWKGYHMNGNPVYDMIYKENGEVFYIEYAYVNILAPEKEGVILQMGTYTEDNSNIEDNRRKEGKWVYWYDNGQKKLEENYQNGKEEGKCIQWYENGQKKWEGNYHKGNLEGKCTCWYENGQKEREGNYQNWEKEGKWIEWYENGQKKSEIIYKNGKEVKGI